ncbi:MAG: FAD:protein FMN transferase [Chloroflexota bacterium]
MIASAEWRALGTSVRLVVRGAGLAAARDAAERVLGEVDGACSRFRPDSELMTLNASAGRTTRISPLLSRALAGALDAARRTGGAVDPTIGRALRVIGYDRDFDLLAAADPARASMTVRVAAVPGWRAVELDVASGTVRVPRGVELDLGATGKGLAADLAAAAAHDATGGGGGVLVSLGGDIATAGRCPDGGWRILAAEDSATPADADGEVVAIERGAIATSTTTLRRWRVAGGATAHHILDPRTGLPARTPWRTATAAAVTCEAANAASTAAIVLGEAAPAWLEAARLPARLVDGDGGVLRLAGWPAPGERPAAPVERPAAPGERPATPGEPAAFVAWTAATAT